MGLCDTSSVTIFKEKTLYHIVCDIWYIDDNASIPEKIRFYRTKRGVTCDMLAELVGVSRYAIMRYETGETEPSLENLRQMATIFDIDADKLYDDYYRFLDYPYSSKIREVRKARKMVQREFGEKLGVTAGTVKRWESGQHGVTRNMWETLKALAII